MRLYTAGTKQYVEHLGVHFGLPKLRTDGTVSPSYRRYNDGTKPDVQARANREVSWALTALCVSFGADHNE